MGLVHNDLKKIHIAIPTKAYRFTVYGSVTGSLLIDAQNSQSDINLVVYDRRVFNQVRAVTRNLINQGAIDDLRQEDWQQS